MTREHAYKLRQMLHKASASLADDEDRDTLETDNVGLEFGKAFIDRMPLENRVFHLLCPFSSLFDFFRRF